jgi:hypothetical protein
MQSKRLEGRGVLRRCLVTCGLAAAIAIVAGASAGPWRSTAKAESAAYRTTIDYVTQFYPLAFTYFQSAVSSKNRFIGPDRISNIYQAVVAINDDTLYASTILTLADEPVVLTLPATITTYSILSLDLYGNILPSKITAGTPGIYAFTGPQYRGVIPHGIKRIKVSLNTSILIIRADRYSSKNKNLTLLARIFRKGLKMQPLSKYKKNPAGGATRVLPELAFALPVKTIIDDAIKLAPIDFLKYLQIAVAKADIPPLSPAAQALSDRFDALFASSDINPNQFKAGARAAHQLILDNYVNHTGRTNWTTFTNIGEWGNNVLDRASITEFCQFCNGRSTAAYFHGFKDDKGRTLNGTRARGYILTFPKSKIPEAERFWSVTAYTPNSIELVKNSAKKYLVARYTKGLQYNSNGSVSIYMATALPAGVPEANWLPVPDGPFNVMLRVYGPEGNTANEAYVPPAIKRR